MTTHGKNGRGRPRARTSMAVLLLATAATACETDTLLEVVDPDLVTPESVKSAELYWAGALGDFTSAVSGGVDGIRTWVGLFTDEFLHSGTFPTRLVVDERNLSTTNGTAEDVFRDLHHARNSASIAATLLAEEDPSDPRIAEMQSLEGFTYVYFGEVYCSGVPFGHSPVNGDEVMGEPQTTAEMFQSAITLFDQAIASAGSSTQLANLARLGKARALLNLGQFDAAAAAAAAVPDGFQYLIRHHAEAVENGIKDANEDAGRWSVADGEGGNGILFRSAMDPRLPWELDEEPGFDSATPLYVQLLWTSEDDDFVLADDLEARLIEAEAALNAGNAGAWLATLNDLRSDTEGLAPLTDPGSADARARLHFEERAFWLYASGHRLGDLRRMIRQYGFTEDEVFPTGQHFKGSAFGDDVNFPIPQDEENNPNFVACIDRAA